MYTHCTEVCTHNIYTQYVMTSHKTPTQRIHQRSCRHNNCEKHSAEIDKTLQECHICQMNTTKFLRVQIKCALTVLPYHCHIRVKYPSGWTASKQCELVQILLSHCKSCNLSLGQSASKADKSTLNNGQIHTLTCSSE